MSGTRAAAASAVAGVLLVVLPLAGVAPTVAPARAAARASRHHRPAPRAPSGPPLAGAGAAPREEAEQTAGIQSVGGDQLAENGLSSPLCKGAAAASLSSASRSNCASSGFVGAAAPWGDYALDVHIDTGAFGLSRGDLLSIVQDMFIAPAWGALEWLAHALVVMLEWCYTLELLGDAGTSTVAHALRQARAAFTEPWLALVLALASSLALYHGIVRRRVADTLGGALTMLAMMAGGLWVIADPGGTVGAVGGWADRASLDTLAASASGSPGHGAATLADSMRALYAAAIETPWCYLEFGNVSWCSDPSRLDPRLRTAALALAAGGKQGGSAPPSHAAELVRAARTNGELFLAFPANGPQRNSINRQSSLLRAICRSEEATKCTGPTAAEAEFRTDGGTFPRLLGLLAIAVGVLGMALLFGLLALRLLAAAFVGLFLLLLAPLAVLAPALGDGGRALFAAWLTRLLGAVSSKLLFSFVLGALLTMQRALAALDTLGWWTQWLLISAFWWTLFVKRHELAATARLAGRQSASPRGGQHGGGAHGRAGGAGAGGGSGGGGGARVRPLRRAEGALQAYGAVRHPARWVEAQVGARIAQRHPREERPAGAGQPGSRPRAPGRLRSKGRFRIWRSRDRGPSTEDRRSKVTPQQRVDPARAPSSAPGRDGSTQPPGDARGRHEPPQPARSRGQTQSPRPPRPGLPPSTTAREQRSPVMEDAFAVMQGRKRQLGYDPKDRSR